MQGFNRYIPPDFDPKKNATLNSYQGKKHALGVRAKDIDKGILVVRFELPFNIWCGSCNAHIGAGVRYNAQKRKVGNYYSTPIFAFRCKCHLCSGWFEIRTDPQNAAYVVHEGARQKQEDWDPAEHGGYAVHDTEKPSASEPSADPFGQVEKTIDQQTWAKQKTSRLTELTHASDRLSSDPYLVSSALRRRFREEKKVLLAKQARDEGVLERYGLAEGVELGSEEVEGGREMWAAARENRGLPVDADKEVGGEGGAGPSRGGEIADGPGPVRNGKGIAAAQSSANTTMGSTPSSLVSMIRKNTAKRYSPFGEAMDAFSSPIPRARGKIRVASGKESVSKTAVGGAVKEVNNVDVKATSGSSSGLLAGYDSD